MSRTASSEVRPGPRPSTSRQEIVDCAIRMLDREGADALTFRAMARELGVTVGALSRYFKNLADLQDEVAAKIMSGLRPLKSAGKLTVRQQLVRLGLDMLEIHRAHPYLLTTHGPASAAVVARHTRQCLSVMFEAGIDFDRAMAIYSLIGNLPYAWAGQGARQSSPELQMQIMQAYSKELGEFTPQLEKLITASKGTALFRHWLELYIDGLLPSQPAAPPI